MEYTLEQALEIFWSQVDVRGENECWVWLGSTNRVGYGYIEIK